MVVLSSGISETPADLRSAEKSLRDATGAAGVLWCGRGATALYWAYRAAARVTGKNDGQIIIPATICESVAHPATIAGPTPRFADVDPATAMPTVDSVRQRITSQTCAIVLAHMFGQTIDVTPFAQFGVPLIEDAAHALGGRLPSGAPVGSAGDMTIFSFNRTKIIEPGGGALLVRSAECWGALRAELQVQTPSMELDPSRFAALAAAGRNLEHATIGLCRAGANDAATSDAYVALAKPMAAAYVQPLADPAALAGAWNGIAGVARRRAEKAEIYANVLAAGPWRLLGGHRLSGVSWRFSLLVDFPRLHGPFIDAIRARGALVSSLYWPLCDFFRPADDCPNARDLAQRVVNLCVDDTVTADWVKARAADILDVGRETQLRAAAAEGPH